MKVTITGDTGVWILSVMFLILFTLKLCKVITVSWWVVTSPLWLPVMVLSGIFLIATILAFLFMPRI